jgi:hypothetical protein
MIVLAILQNTWARDPARVTESLERFAKLGIRHKFVAKLLFSGSLTGRRIQAAFGSFVDDMIFEEASPIVTGASSGSPPADFDHLRECIDRHKPDVIISFGKTASDAVAKLFAADQIQKAFHFLRTVHPACRDGSTPEQLQKTAQQLFAILP